MKYLSFGCWQCGRFLAIAKNGLCCHCQGAISTPPYCFHCGNATSHYISFCGKCSSIVSLWQNMVVAGQFSPPLSSLIHRFKFQGAYYLDRTLARLLLLAVKNARREQFFPLPEVLIPVPLHHLRQWSRGYNQSQMLATYLGKWLGVPVDSHLIYRHKRTSPQRGLNAKIRQKNVKGVFRLLSGKVCPYRSVAIVDDVITTGETVAEMAKILRQAGVLHIQVWGLSRA